MAAVRTDLEAEGVKADESVDLLEFYARKVKKAQQAELGLTDQAGLSDEKQKYELIGIINEVRRYVDENGHVRTEGTIGLGVKQAYRIGYDAITPRREQCANLLVPVCLSASHIAYGSIRMEPVFMVLGQSAATAAAIAIDDNVPVQKVNYEKLRARLVADHAAERRVGLEQAAVERDHRDAGSV